MDLGKIASPFFLACDWIMKLAYVNILWFGFTLLGGVIFGMAPATASVFTVVRKWIEGDRDIAITKLFWNTFRKEFIKVNLLAFTLLVIGAILLFDIYFFQNMEGVLSQILHIVFIVAFVNFVIVLLYIFPVYVHYELRVFQYLKYACILALSNPFQSLLMASLAGFSMFIVIWNSALFLFFSVAPISMILMLITYRIFDKIQNKHGEKTEESTATARATM
ncbi:putative membrane protein YesL [Evansella vedderi]|uniref:Membrane protein YesL n=1 Tax=Evansella vedderi TaxID=38282 RepID=A0ABT9ZXI2_9BACI|nr:YesL family protein [Evansella vedderi]MDQ0255944.1 putative membrane protein YesL [Evansella vedderi]